MSRLNRAKEILQKESFTCVVLTEQGMLTSKERGVTPALMWLDTGESLADSTVADKVIGKAAAFLFALADIREITASVMSRAAIEVFEKHHIRYECDEVTERIQNRTHTGFCPMETAVQDVEDPEEALRVIRETRRNMMNKHAE